MSKKLAWAIASLLLLAACAPAGRYASTESLTVLETRVAVLESGGVSAGDALADVETRLAALETRVAALEEMSGAGAHAEAGGFELAVAQYVMDTAGFHAMDEALSETQTVDPAFLSTVNRVAKVVGVATWPEDLHEQVNAFQAVLADFAAALEADDAAAAAELAVSVHEAQHDLSGSIDAALGAGEHGH